MCWGPVDLVTPDSVLPLRTGHLCKRTEQDRGGDAVGEEPAGEQVSDWVGDRQRDKSEKGTLGIYS